MGSSGPIVIAVLEAPWGPLHVAATSRGIAAIEHLAPTDGFVARLERRFRAPTAPLTDRPARDPAAALVRTAQDALESYFEGHSIGDPLPLDLADRPAWDRVVLEAVREVGFGEVTSYGRIARRIGRPGAGRAVGGAVGRNPIGILIPCHRVIAGDGTIGGYGGAWWGTRDQMLEIKRLLLDREGVRLPHRWPAGEDAEVPRCAGRGPQPRGTGRIG
jgi:methylated-DNA-[protein]-cysteine S-methyltransferase